MFGIFLILCAVLLIYYFIAKEFYNVAEAKGYGYKKYFWICFLFSFIGYLLVIALPDRGSEKKKSNDELPFI